MLAAFLLAFPGLNHAFVWLAGQIAGMLFGCNRRICGGKNVLPKPRGIFQDYADSLALSVELRIWSF
jgi:hypothetical protein